MQSDHLMSQAIALAVENVRSGNGGPFAAIVAREGEIVATGVNCVTSAKDPTAHAEVVAIRNACRVLAAFQLTGCEIYTTCEPCPMCLGAIYWARPARVWFAATSAQAAAAGFDDSFIYRELALGPAARAIPMEHLEHCDAQRPFDVWAGAPGKVLY